MKNPFKPTLKKWAVRQITRLAGAGLWYTIPAIGYYAWKFVYDTDNQFGHIIVALIVACAWIVYAVVAAIVGFILLESK